MKVMRKACVLSGLTSSFQVLKKETTVLKWICENFPSYFNLSLLTMATVSSAKSSRCEQRLISRSSIKILERK